MNRALASPGGGVHSGPSWRLWIAATAGTQRRYEVCEALAAATMRNTSACHWWRPASLTPRAYYGLAFYVIWSVGMLLFVIPAEAAEGIGFSLLGMGLILALLHRPIGWLVFKFDSLHIGKLIDSWEGLGLRGAQTWYLAFGLVTIGIGCIYLIRALM